MYHQWRYKSQVPNNIVHCLTERQIVISDVYRDQLTCKINHQIVSQPSTTFENVWTKTSKMSMCIGLDRRIYFNNHQDCYFNDGHRGEPHRLYHFADGKSKIWAVILYHCHIRKKVRTQEEQEVCLVVLTSEGYLKVLNADTGEILRSIYLATDVVFRYLLWANYLHTIQVKSVQAIRQLPRHLTSSDNVTKGRVLSLMIFKVHPIEFVAYFHIEKHIFGEDTRDASVTEDLLIVMNHSKQCRYYDLQWIINNYTTVNVKLDEIINLDDTTRFYPGVYPNSIPVSIHMTATPPILFETKCNPEVGISFGGNPLVFLHNAYPLRINEFHIKELQTGKLVDTLSTDILSFHQDVAEFHFDDFQRLLHISGCTLSCHRLKTNHMDLRSQLSLELVYYIDFKQVFQVDNIIETSPQVSKRGRVIKRKKPTASVYEDFVSAVQDLDYENELELLYAVVTVPQGENTKAFLCFLDDKDGQIDNVIPIPTWDPSGGNNIYYELDCILHLVQHPGCNTCHYYRLRRDINS